ncbi:MAG: antirestriction protein, partial [Oscillospiraceae bacterium]
AVRDEAGKVQDIIAGPFFVCGLGEDDFCPLPKELQAKYLDMFKYPEKFTAIGGKLVITQDKPRAPARQEAER